MTTDNKYTSLLAGIAKDLTAQLSAGNLPAAIEKARTLGNLSDLVQLAVQHDQAQASSAVASGAARFFNPEAEDAAAFLDRCIAGEAEALSMAATTANSSFIEQVSQD